MPITRRQFEMGINPEIEEWMRKIHTHLAEHKDKAFAASELWDIFGGVFGGPTGGRRALETALDELVQLEAADGRVIKGTVFYSCGSKQLEI